MSVSNNVPKYEEIRAELDRNPDASITALCNEKGVKYQAFYLWNKRHSDGKSTASPGSAGPSTKLTKRIKANVLVSLGEIVNCIASGVRTIPVSVDQIVRGLPPAEQTALALELGKKQLAGNFKNNID